MIARHPRTTRRAIGRFVAGALLAAAGCGGPRPCAVTGKVLVDGTPAEGVYVVLHPVGVSAREPGTGRSGGDGSFALEIAKPGQVAITAFWPKVTNRDDETTESGDLFDGAHRDPGRPVSKAQIHEGENALPPIQLSLPASKKADARRR